MFSHLLILFLYVLSPSDHGAVKMYNKEYHSNGTLKAEGWMISGKKANYWYQYHKNGQLASKGHYQGNNKSAYWYYYDKNGSLVREGHYNNGIAENWWIFYDLATQEIRKTQYQNNQKNGFSLIYKKNKLVKVEKYIQNEYKGTWTSIRSFRRDNPDVKLY
ncbi:toxin-antitoxin system YwqK family antitoxin [Dokdonia ponticola]|uniref:Toxin-antitoxin system YwqK family antitoxin n=1 Tax=Dokdonia ponticola TaxID=2041041 RepID=A0ABV9HVW8_9FLAO